MASVDVSQLFVSFLEDRGVLTQFLDNFEAHSRRHSGIWGSRSFDDYCSRISAKDLLTTAFKFNGTPEGGSFWVGIQWDWEQVLRALDIL